MPEELAPAEEYKGAMGAAVRLLAELLAETPAFRAKLGVESQADALAAIYDPYRTFEWQAEPDRPFAVIWCSSWSKAKGGFPPLRLRNCTLALVLYLPDDPGNEPEWAQARFSAWLDEVTDQMADLEGVDDRLCIQSISLAEGNILPPNVNAEGERGAHWTAKLDIAAGATGGGD